MGETLACDEGNDLSLNTVFGTLLPSQKGHLKFLFPNQRLVQNMAFPRMFLTLGFVVLALSVVPWSSQAKAPDAYGEAVEILVGEGGISFEDRKIVARGFEVECGKLSKKIPELSPRENDWLDAELEAGRAEREAGRIMALLGTVEAAKRYSKQTLVACHDWAQLISQVQPGELEVYYWANVLGAIADEHLSGRLQVLKQSNTTLLTDDDIDSVRLFFGTGLRLMIDKILIPLTRPAP